MVPNKSCDTAIFDLKSCDTAIYRYLPLSEHWECRPLDSFQVCESLCRLSAEEQDALIAEASCEGLRARLEVEHGLCEREDVCDSLCRHHRDCIDETACWNACVE